ncbi:hypothetical protein IU500_24650 [Nocardia terpenica]|uniref:hypothetical protein n=1 Tax=Nocardia terpenica TaxID=455432 RepID=UPI00189468FB|nr:hypothetical protein [Nocardia terpenica]MBF6064691.1 hypothetical protein [Nocardia terpenica]MBF6107207.1 hypothetical protein [Nocardia terpenica]MBF6114965.1 hypothetical protein [Nocardia terpenica]MBF6122070.1 hypothetical protein [Nocardia terpenica]MBF6154453.1 hypothetical protein [Nocardia terpenica]
MSPARTTRIAGIRILTPDARQRVEATAASGRGLRKWHAKYRLWQDDARRATVQRRETDTTPDGFARKLATLTDRGYRGLGGGRAAVVPAMPEWRATTTQVAGLWPFAVGAAAPAVGTPVGHHYVTGEPVHFDPMAWFLRGFITAPSMFVLALNGFGKSSLIRRVVTGAVATGDTAMCLGDTKPDYRDLVETLGGQVIDLGYGYGKLNPLAVGALGGIVDQLPDPEMRRQVTARVEAGQVTVVAGLIELVRGARVADYEETLLAAGLRELYGPGGFTPDHPPLLEDLLAVISRGGEQMMQFAEEDCLDAYRAATKPLRRSLRALVEGPFGEIFNGHTTMVLDPASPAVCMDVSHIPEGDTKLLSAVLMVCWSDGFGAIAAAHTLADAGLAPKRVFHVVMDEIWRVLGVGEFMVDRVDSLTRLNRPLATSLIMCSHTIKDLGAFNTQSSVNKALGFIERARAKVIGPVGSEEIERLRTVMSFTETEKLMVTSWSAPRPLTDNQHHSEAVRETPAGTGCFLLKTGEDNTPGIPFRMTFTPSERDSGIHNTNKRFDGLNKN